MEALGPSPLHEAVISQDLSKVSCVLLSLYQNELERTLKKQYNDDTPISLAFKLGLKKIAAVLLQRAVLSKDTKLASIDIDDILDTPKYWRYIFDLMAIFLPVKSKRVRAKEMAAKMRFITPYIAKGEIDLCTMADKPKFIVTALLLGADPEPKSNENSWVWAVLQSKALHRNQKKALFERIMQLDLISKNPLPVSVWAKYIADGNINVIAPLLKLIYEDIESQDEYQNNALHIASRLHGTSGFIAIRSVFKNSGSAYRSEQLIDMLLQKNNEGKTPLELILFHTRLPTLMPEEFLMALKKSVEQKDIQTIRGIFSLHNWHSNRIYPIVSRIKTVLLFMHSCGLTYEFLAENSVHNAEYMLEIENLTFNDENVPNNEKISTSQNESANTFNFDELPNELIYIIASNLRPMDIYSLFITNKRMTGLLRSDRNESFWKSISDRCLFPNIVWTGPSYKQKVIQDIRCGIHWRQKERSTITLNKYPKYLDDNWLICLDPADKSVYYWNCHTQKLTFSNVPVSCNSLKVFHLINRSDRDVPMIIGNTDRNNVIIKDQDLILCAALNEFSVERDCEGVALIDNNTLLLSDHAALYDIENDKILGSLPRNTIERHPSVCYNPYNRTIIRNNRIKKEIEIYDLNHQLLQKIHKYTGNMTIQLVDEYTLAYYTYGSLRQILTHSLGLVDLRTGSIFFEIDGFTHLKSASTSQRMLFYDDIYNIVSSFNFEARKWEFVEHLQQRQSRPLLANTRYCVTSPYLYHDPSAVIYDYYASHNAPRNIVGGKSVFSF